MIRCKMASYYYLANAKTNNSKTFFFFFSNIINLVGNRSYKKAFCLPEKLGFSLRMCSLEPATGFFVFVFCL